VLFRLDLNAGRHTRGEDQINVITQDFFLFDLFRLVDYLPEEIPEVDCDLKLVGNYRDMRVCDTY
jgi:hypothetical protein